MFGTLAIALLDQRVVTEPVGFSDRRLEIVDNHLLGGAVEKLESVAVKQNPVSQALFKDEFDEHMPAVSEGHYKEPGFAQLSGSLVN